MTWRQRQRRNNWNNNNSSNNNSSNVIALPPKDINVVRLCINLRPNNITHRIIYGMSSSTIRTITTIVTVMIYTNHHSPPILGIIPRKLSTMIKKKKKKQRKKYKNVCYTIQHYGIWSVKRSMRTHIPAINIVIVSMQILILQINIILPTNLPQRHPTTKPRMMSRSIGPLFYLMDWHPIPNPVDCTINNWSKKCSVMDTMPTCIMPFRIMVKYVPSLVSPVRLIWYGYQHWPWWIV